MLIICDTSRFTRTYVMRQKYDTVAPFEQFLADERVTGTPSAVPSVEMVRSDEGGEFKGDFAKLYWHEIRQDFTTADSSKFNGVPERHMSMVESASVAAQVQA